MRRLVILALTVGALFGVGIASQGSLAPRHSVCVSASDGTVPVAIADEACPPGPIPIPSGITADCIPGAHNPPGRPDICVPD